MHVWIVEMLIGKKWYPTCRCRTNRELGQLELRDWRKKNPTEKYRLAKYVAANLKRRSHGLDCTIPVERKMATNHRLPGKKTRSQKRIA